jgi:hypothetical protein
MSAYGSIDWWIPIPAPGGIGEDGPGVVAHIRSVAGALDFMPDVPGRVETEPNAGTIVRPSAMEIDSRWKAEHRPVSHRKMGTPVNDSTAWMRRR